MTGIFETARRFRQDEDGSTLVEFAVVLPLFLALFFALVDFGRMGGDFVLADKAMQRAARIAAVRPPVCAGVPSSNARGILPAGTVPPSYGTRCAAGICLDPGIITCTSATGAAGQTTAGEIWQSVSPLLPASTTIDNIRFTYSYDHALNFLGGPYVPTVSVELTGMQFNFVTPLGGLLAIAGGTGAAPAPQLSFPPMRVTLPAEDLDHGTNG